ncbi:hypothetical protein JCM15765_36230 [Paradesulfitobacterium aromaticivorans]
MPLPKEGEKYTYADYLTWPEDERWEIIDGIPYMQAAPTPVHQEVLTELVRQIANYLTGKPCKVQCKLCSPGVRPCGSNRQGLEFKLFP